MYTLRAARVEETEAIAAFMERVIVTSVDATPEERIAFVANTRRNLDLWLSAPEDSFHVTARLNGHLVGVLLARDFWNLCHLFVAPAHQGHGLGRRLLESAFAACAGRSPRGYIRLNASRNAVGFYKHMGFSEVLDAPPHYRGVQFQRTL